MRYYSPMTGRPTRFAGGSERDERGMREDRNGYSPDTSIIEINACKRAWHRRRIMDLEAIQDWLLGWFQLDGIKKPTLPSLRTNQYQRMLIKHTQILFYNFMWRRRILVILITMFSPEIILNDAKRLGLRIVPSGVEWASIGLQKYWEGGKFHNPIATWQCYHCLV